MNWEADREKGHHLKAGAKEFAYDAWNLRTFGFLGSHDEDFEEYERTGDRSAYIKSTVKEVGRAGVQIATTAATGETVAVGKTVTTRVIQAQ